MNLTSLQIPKKPYFNKNHKLPATLFSSDIKQKGEKRSSRPNNFLPIIFNQKMI